MYHEILWSDVISVRQPSILYLCVVHTDETSNQQRSFAISIHESCFVRTVLLLMWCDFLQIALW